jgi:hypothetical protein
MIEEAILAWLMAQPIHKTDVGEVDRLSRLSQVAEAIGVVSGGNKLLAASLMIQAREESGLRRDVQVGQCPPKLCDQGAARSLWQLHRPSIAPIGTWMGWAGPDYGNVLAAATQAARALRAGRAMCGNIEGAFAIYATGHSCHRETSRRRAAMAVELAGKL